MSEPAGFYERIDATSFRATTATQSPWDERLQHGSPPTALIARAIAHAHPRDDVRIARVAAEFLGPIPLATVTVETRVVRPGKRIELLEAVLRSGERDVVIARVWRIAVRGAASVPAGVTPRDRVPALPPAGAGPRWLAAFGYGRAFDWRYVRGEDGGPAEVWARARLPLVAGEPAEPLDRALLLVDSANGVSRELPFGVWMFVPPSLSVALERYPRGDWVLLDARTTLGDDGLGVTAGRLGDEHGYFGALSQALVIDRMPP